VGLEPSNNTTFLSIYPTSQKELAFTQGRSMLEPLLVAWADGGDNGWR
jgi:hypothetical protein